MILRYLNNSTSIDLSKYYWKTPFSPAYASCTWLLLGNMVMMVSDFSATSAGLCPIAAPASCSLDMASGYTSNTVTELP